MGVWRVAYPTQVLELDVHGEVRPVKVIGGQDDFRLQEQALAHIEQLRRMWPGLRVIGPELVEEPNRRARGRGVRK